MNIEDEAMREDKLKQLNYLVGELSFPPLPPAKKSIYHLWYGCHLVVPVLIQRALAYDCGRHRKDNIYACVFVMNYNYT